MAPVHSVLALWPGASPVQAQAPADSVIRIWDSLTGRFADSVVVRSPRPDPLVPIVQWTFQRPGWVMVGGVVLGAILALAVLVMLCRWRRALWTWLISREREVKLAMAGAVGAVLLLIARGPVGGPGNAKDRTVQLEHPMPVYLVYLTGSSPPNDDPPESRIDVSFSPSDTFPHARHSKLACLTCHDLRSKERRLTFEAPRGCQICHHQRPAQADCKSCHQPSELAPTFPTQVAVAVPKHDPRRRTVQFPHAKHDTLACTGCHVTPVSLEPADSAKTCTGCHEKHHAESRDCATCHRTAAITAPHRMPVQAHTRCDACHTPATIARLVPTRSFCLACHQPQQDHYQPKECSSCHFQRTPGELQPKLTRAVGSS
jgi:hypothetical protein